MTRKKNKKSRAVAKVVAHFKNTYNFTHDDGRLLAFQNLCRHLHVNVGHFHEQCKKVSSTEGFKVEYYLFD